MSPRRPPNVELPNIRGQVSHDVEQAIERLRESVEQALAANMETREVLDARGAHLTLEEIREALGPMGSDPLETAGLLNTTPPQTSPVPPPGTVPEDNTDNGQGGLGCAAASGSGHVPGASIDPFRAGQITCGTCNEWAVLKAPTANEADRTANAITLLRRVIWHLQTQGYTAGRQRNPSGVLSNDKFTVQTETDGVLTMRAYDFLSLTAYTEPMTSHMIEVFPAEYVADGGIPD